ncbi:hypothetical protein APHAL10511_008424 [Amanita phalloides]|nr:hypothetical protein APHAL10511_008424 [Amanita phalloides]
MGAVLDNFRSVQEIDIQTFITSFLPPCPSGINLQGIFRSLHYSLGLQRIRGHEGASYYWDVFETEPAAFTVAEGATFDKLMEIYNAVIEEAAISRETRITKLCLNPNKVPSLNRTHATRPDGCMILTRPCMGDHVQDCWEDVAVTMEFKKRNDEFDCIDNIEKQIFSMQQVMAFDPCRRFTFGLTIENTDVRLWFCSRSMTAVSKTFDLNKHPQCLILAFLSFTYASKADLGWDETMKPKIIGGEKRYEIKVGDNTYETQGDALSDVVARSVVGRATRVYKVKKLQDTTGQMYVLKDVWLAKGRRPEHTIREEILEDIERVLGENDKKKVEKHLFTPVDHCIVQVETKDKGWVDDDTHDVILRKAEFSTSNRLRVTNLNHTSDYVVTRAPPDHKNITHRYHYRIVYEELAVPLYDLKQVSLIFHLFYELVQVLDIFHRAGWVHRDLSAGNVFLHENERFKLGDLEFAKKMGKTGERDVRTGTLDIVAFEVERQKYMYLPDGPPKPFFYHNSLHELESVWWLATWCLFFHRPSESEQAPEDLTGQRNALDALFPRRMNDLNRFEFFSVDQMFSDFTRYLHPDLHRIGTEGLRVSLKAAYKSFEARLLEQDALVYFSQNRLNNIHDVFISKFKEIWTQYAANDIKLVSVHGIKREHSGTEYSPEAKRYKSEMEKADEYHKTIMANGLERANCNTFRSYSSQSRT